MYLLCLLLLFFADTPNALSLLKKGLVELQQGDVQAARADLESASKVDDKNPLVWSALAEVYARTKEFDSAKAAADKAESNGSNNPIVAHALAIYYSDTSQWEKAARAESRYAKSPQADKFAKSRAAAWYLAAGDTTEALAVATDVAAGDSQTAFDLAQLFLRKEQFQPAAELLTSALKAHPNDPQLTLALGVARYGERRFDDAIAAFLTVIRLDQQIEQPYLFLGRMLDQAGPHLAEIQTDAQSWSDKNPQNAKAQLLLAKVWLTANPSDSRAEPLLRRSIALDANDWEAHYQLGVLLEDAHHYPDAATELQRAVELNKSEAAPHYQLARVYDRMGNTAGAAAERAIHKQLTENGKSQ